MTIRLADLVENPITGGMTEWCSTGPEYVFHDKGFVYILRHTSLSRVQLAQLLGVSLPTIRRWCTGRELPPKPARIRIVERLVPHAKA